MMSIKERLNRLSKEIKNEKFIKNGGLGNEISFYIFSYKPKYELLVRKHVEQITKSMENIKVFNLYEMLIEMLKEDDLIEASKNMEKEYGNEEILNALTRFATPDRFIEKIAQESTDFDIIFITGVGQIYPLIRSHTILNKLHDIIENKPLILFYPGEYTGRELILFNKFKDDNYYRAFPLIND